MENSIRYVAIAAVATILGQGSLQAQSQGFGYQMDPQVEGAIYEMINTTGYYCQLGDQTACNSANYWQQFGFQMYGFGEACQNGNEQACGSYQQAYGQLEQGYYSLQQEVAQIQAQQGGGFGYNDGLTHEQRMQQIQNFGDANTARWNQQQMQNDANHQAFIESIRN